MVTKEKKILCVVNFRYYYSWFNALGNIKYSTTSKNVKMYVSKKETYKDIAKRLSVDYFVKDIYDVTPVEEIIIEKERYWNTKPLSKEKKYGN